MKVDNPRFNNEVNNKVYCIDCPWADADGDRTRSAKCGMVPCPTAETYNEQCRLAEQANKGE